MNAFPTFELHVSIDYPSFQFGTSFMKKPALDIVSASSWFMLGLITLAFSAPLVVSEDRSMTRD